MNIIEIAHTSYFYENRMIIKRHSRTVFRYKQVRKSYIRMESNVICSQNNKVVQRNGNNYNMNTEASTDLYRFHRLFTPNNAKAQ